MKLSSQLWECGAVASNLRVSEASHTKGLNTHVRSLSLQRICQSGTSAVFAFYLCFLRCTNIIALFQTRTFSSRTKEVAVSFSQALPFVSSFFFQTSSRLQSSESMNYVLLTLSTCTITLIQTFTKIPNQKHKFQLSFSKSLFSQGLEIWYCSLFIHILFSLMERKPFLYFLSSS